MLIRSFIISVLVLSVTYASYNDNSLSNFGEVLKNEIYRKLDAIDKRNIENVQAIIRNIEASEKRIPAQLNDLENKLAILGKKYQDLEETREKTLHEKLHKQEEKIIKKLAMYIEEKLDLTEKHIYNKIDSLEKITADKTDVEILNHKLEELRKIQPDVNESLYFHCDSNNLTNKTIEKMNEDINRKLQVIDSKITVLKNTTTYFEFQALDKSIQENLNRKVMEIKSIIPVMEENLKQQLDVLNKKISENLEEKINLKLDSVQKTILNLTEKIGNCDTNNTFTNLNHTVTETIKNNSKIGETNRGLKTNTTLSKTLEDRNKTIVLSRKANCDCKKRVVTGYDFKPISIDNTTLNHVTVSADADGLAYFEINLALKATGSQIIQLSPTSNPGKNDSFIFLEIGNDFKSIITVAVARPQTDDSNSFRHIQTLRRFETPTILSPTKFTTSYFRIINGTLEMGREGTDSPPAVKYSDERFRAVKYIGFTSWNNRESTFYYDCPPYLDETNYDCKKQVGYGYNYNPISIDNTTLKHVTVSVDADGLAYFEMNLAMRAVGRQIIQLSPMPNPGKNDSFFYLLIGNNLESTIVLGEAKPETDDSSGLHHIKFLSWFDATTILSSTKYTTSYFRIKNGTLEMGKEGTDSPPAVKYSDERFRSVKYIGFTSLGSYISTFYYDCPPAVPCFV